jgi:peptidase YpeB-like protein
MMKKLLSTTSALLLIGVASAQAQSSSETRIRVQKDVPMTASGEVIDYVAEARVAPEWYRPAGTTCSSVDVQEARTIQIKTDLYDPATMISPDSAKMIALCVVPGQIGSGEMEMTNGRPEYEISIIPERKRTYTKVIIDAQTGAVLSTKQFGGLRGAAGWLRESFEHKENKP